MSDQRIRDLEAAVQRGEPGAREALDRARCRSGAHAWSCRDTNGVLVSYIWCIRCLAQRPKDEHETGVEWYLARLATQAAEAHGRAVRRHGRNGSGAEFERLQGEISKLAGALFDYRTAIAPHIVIAMPVHTPSSIGVAVEALPMAEPVRVVIDPPARRPST